MKRFAFGALRALGVLVGLYLIARAVAEPFVIDVTDPASYRDDWGGPALAGVLAVHMGPGILAGLALFGAARRRLTAYRNKPSRSALHAEPTDTEVDSTLRGRELPGSGAGRLRGDVSRSSGTT